MFNLPDFPAAGHRRSLPFYPASSDALVLAQLSAKQTAQTAAPILVICANALDCRRLEDELKWFSPNAVVRILPDWETLPYDQLSPHQDLISERLATLYALTQERIDIVLVAAQSALYAMAPPQYLAARTFFLKQGERLDSERLRLQMSTAGYENVAQVVSPGEFAVRGGIIDLFPMGSVLPLRLDLFDDEIETIKTFDPDTQRTIYPVPEIRLLPAREFALDEAGQDCFRSRFRATFEGDASRVALYKAVSNGTAAAGIEYYLPLFFEQQASLFDYLPPNSAIVLLGDIAGAINTFWQDTQQRYKLLNHDRQRPILPPEQLFLRDEAFFKHCKQFPCLHLPQEAESTKHSQNAIRALASVAVENKAADPFHALRALIQQGAARIRLLVESAGRRETLIDTLAAHDLHPVVCDHFTACLNEQADFAVAIAPLSNGFHLLKQKISFISEYDLYAQRQRSRRGAKRATSVEGWLRDLSELKPGDLIVHCAHGIGRYLGLVHMDMPEGAAEFLHLQYADEASLYVPVAQLHVVTRYAGADPEQVTLHRLGSGQWEKARKKAAAKAHDTAAELLALYAQRAARSGSACTLQAGEQERFAEGFEFETTADQQAAINAVLDDLAAERPMDRLVCGDVGFGKTEVALRAAFAATQDGRQVAVLTPTTLLTEQHAQTFRDRFASWPTRIVELSRFKSAREQKQALDEIANGSADIVIGTHRLLQKDISFARLGLVIIDEEHRFGVRQKETLKALRANVDVLTLTATPIPRTLGLALEGLREFSVIATAPQKRLAIKTFVQSWSRSVVREAVLREFRRGGQVYYLHNDVASIEAVRNELESLLPEARIVVGHGQMHERELERVMREFTHQRANLLLCTTIIETGLDIPTANTIIIARAERFGLAQLHQLRGRVGRSHHQAYAYLLTVRDAKPGREAQKRLEAIAAMDELGAGFYLAMHDLEIRGAGEILGDNQSGDIQQIGFSLYTEMLSRAVRDLKAGKKPLLDAPMESIAEIRLGQPALLPEEYCPDVEERLTLYKRLTDCQQKETLDDLRAELIDRFGTLPPAAKTLLASHQLRIHIAQLGVRSIDANAQRIRIDFAPDAPVDPAAILVLIQQDRNTRLESPTRIGQSGSFEQLSERLQAIEALLKNICLQAAFAAH